MSKQFPLQPGHLVDRRYTILQQLGHGGFGRTYLATDSRRHNERCVLKEFAPLVTAYAEDIEKARELFRREAAVLHRLRHPQIPEFREEFEVFEAGQMRWMLVQEWIAGETYLELLRSGPLLEVQVVQFLLDFLPILNYLHNHQPPVIHRDISLDNILLNSVSNQPTLIDFGTVKQAMHQVSGFPAERPTLIAKRGYSPPEQTLGEAYPSSDLYALGVCAIALLTGQRNPAVLYDAHGDRWHWHAHAVVSSGLGAILDRLLQSQPRFRYDSAADVISALTKLSSADLPPASKWRPTQAFSGPPTPQSAKGLPKIPLAAPPPISVPYRSIPWQEGMPRAQRQAMGLRESVAHPGVPAPLPRTQQLTIAVGRAVPQEREATQFIWPLWAQPLLFVQPLLSLLAFRVGPTLLVMLLLYGGVRRISRPEVQWPAIVLPPIDLSEVDVPEMNLPKIEWPKVDGSQVKWSEIKLPEVKLPEKLAWPTFDLPEIKLPPIDLSAKPEAGQGCRETAIARFNQLPPEKASWNEVDKQFAARYPNYPTPLEPTNPEHKALIESWCEVANTWLDQVQ